VGHLGAPDARGEREGAEDPGGRDAKSQCNSSMIRAILDSKKAL